MTIEQTIADTVASAIKPLLQSNQELTQTVRRLEAKLNQPTSRALLVKKKELPERIGTIGRTKLDEILRIPGAPKANAIGLWDVDEVTSFIKSLKDVA